MPELTFTEKWARDRKRSYDALPEPKADWQTFKRLVDRHGKTRALIMVVALGEACKLKTNKKQNAKV